MQACKHASGKQASAQARRRASAREHESGLHAHKHVGTQARTHGRKRAGAQSHSLHARSRICLQARTQARTHARARARKRSSRQQAGGGDQACALAESTQRGTAKPACSPRAQTALQFAQLPNPRSGPLQVVRSIRGTRGGAPGARETLAEAERRPLTPEEEPRNQLRIWDVPRTRGFPR